MDVFDQILLQDEKSHEAGIREGQQDGTATGFIEGFCFGWTKGWEVGMEIGFYRGYAKCARDHFTSSQQGASDSSRRKLQSVNQLIEILERIDLKNVKADSLSDDIILARRKFRQIFPGIFKSKNDPENSTTF